MRLNGLRFAREECLDLDASLGRTWLLADGAGARAAGTALGFAASRHHGLLVAPADTGAPHLFLARTEEWVLEGERALPVSSGRYPGALHPSGHTFLAEFSAWPRPRWLYRVGDVEVTREVALLARDEGPRADTGSTVLLRFTVKGPKAAARRLTIRPLLACRAAGALTHENPHVERRVECIKGGIVARPYPALLPLALTLSGAPSTFTAAPDWFRRAELPADLAAGLPGHEDHFTPGFFTVEVGGGADVVLAATTGPALADPRSRWPDEGGRARTNGAARPTLGACLTRAAEHHLVRTPAGVSVLDALPAGGSTALVRWEALPGLLLARGRVREFGAALLAGAQPDLEIDSGPAREAALAWARCVGLHAAAPGRSANTERALEKAAFALGARLRAAAEKDSQGAGSGLLAGAAEPGPDRLDVALNARWFALAARLAERSRGSAGRGAERRGWGRTKNGVGEAFLARFWLDGPGHLADAWANGAPDTRVRAGMVRAAAEARSPLAREQRQAVVERARTDLVTPRGLRTLSPRDPGYHPAGAVEARGLEAYVEASLLAFGRRARARLAALVAGFAGHLGEHGLGHVAAVFDGEPPHAPGGAPSDARAVAALLRASALLGLGTR